MPHELQQTTLVKDADNGARLGAEGLFEVLVPLLNFIVNLKLL